MLFKLTVLLLCFLFVGITTINAQDIEIFLPECSSTERALVMTVFEDGNYLQDFRDIGQRFSESTLSDLPNLISEINVLQSNWWEEAVPQFPSCAFAVQFSLLYGRLLDEFFIAALLLQGQLNALTTGNLDLAEQFGDMAQEHTGVISALGTNITSLLSTETVTANPTQTDETAGKSRLNPVPIRQPHEIRIFDDVLGEVEILQFDNNALETVLAADDRNEEPPRGFRYIRVLVRFKCTFPPDKSCRITLSDFDAVGHSGIAYRAERIQGLNDEVGYNVFGGSEIEFHLVYIVSEEDDNFVIFNHYDDPVFFSAKN